MSRFFMIIGESLDEYQRELIHSYVKEKSDAWWHQHPDIWITDSGPSAAGLRERLGVIVPKAPGALYVLELPEEGGRSWSARGAKYKWGWLYQNYASPDGGPPDKDYEVPDRPRPVPSYTDEEPF